MKPFSSNDIMFVFDLIILVLGVFWIISAVHMKNTGIPSPILIAKEELPKIKHPEKFCRLMCRPTVILGVIACLYSGADLFNRFVTKLPFVDLFGVVCFLIVCTWYVKEMRAAKENN